MNKLLPALFLATAPLLALGTARAALDPGTVGADAQWVVYADLGAMRSSAIGAQLMALATKNEQANLGDIQVRLDLPKLLATADSFTAYGTNLSGDPKSLDGAMVVRGTPNLVKIAEGLLAQATVTTPGKVTDAAGFPFSTYLLGGQLLIGFPTDRMVLVSKSKEKLLNALEVARGNAPSLAKTPSSPINALLKNSEGAYFFTASVVPSAGMFPQGGPQTRILQMTRSGSIAIGEEGANTSAHVMLVADSDPMAEKLNKILQGLTALLSLGESNDKALSTFMNSATVRQSGHTVTLDLAYPTAGLVNLIKTAQGERLAEAGRNPRNGKVVAEWRAEPAAAAAAGTPVPLAWKTVDNVHLDNGAMVTVQAAGIAGEHRERFDEVEISPMAGQGMPLVFKAGSMRLTGFRISPNARVASGVGGRFAQAQFSFPGEDGLYKVRVHYADDSAGQATFSLSVKEAAPAPAAPDDAARPDNH